MNWKQKLLGLWFASKGKKSTAATKEDLSEIAELLRAASVPNELSALAASMRNLLDPHRTGVIRGEKSEHNKDPRISISQYEEDRITFGMYMGESHWFEIEFSPEHALGIIGVILSKSAVAALLKEKRP